MVDTLTVALIVVAVGASFFAAWTIGAGSTGSTPFAPAVGAHAITTMRAAFIVGILGFAGAVLQGAAITETIGVGLVGGTTLTPLAATIALALAAANIAAGVFKGYPIATAFAVTGSVVGVGMAMGGAPVWTTYLEIGAYWILTPIVVAPPAYALTKILRSERTSEAHVLTLLAGAVGIVVANMEFLLFGAPGEEASIASTIARPLPIPDAAGIALGTIIVTVFLATLVYRTARRDPVATQRYFLFGIGGLVAFTAGGGKVGLAVGPLLPLLDVAAIDVHIAIPLLFGGIGILLGSWMVAPRMIKALTQDYAGLGPRRSIAVLIPSFIIAQIGIFFGLPMSFNQIFIAAIAGTGAAVGITAVSRVKLFWTGVAWVGSLLFGLIAGYGLYLAISTATGIQ